MLILGSIGLGVLGSIVASVIFLIASAQLRPRIKIAPRVSKTPTPTPTSTTADDPFEYRIKFVNKSRRPCVNVSVSVFLVNVQAGPSPKDHQPGKVHAMKSVKNSKSGGYVPGKRKRDRDDRHAQRVLIEPHIINEWLRDCVTCHMLVRVVATDEWSGFTRVAEQPFELANNNIELGVFQTGDSLDVVPWTPPGA